MLAFVTVAMLVPAASAAAPPELSEFPLAQAVSPFGIARVSDGAMWFTERATDSIGRIESTARSDRGSIAVRKAAEQFAVSGVTLRVLEDEADQLGLADAYGGPGRPVGPLTAASWSSSSAATERCCALGVRPGRRTPLLGVNLGHVGFLAEAEPEDLDKVVPRAPAGDTRSRSG